MELRVLGCHGGESPRHRTSSFLLDAGLLIDAGAVTSTLGLDEQRRIDTVLVSHAHLDHVRDLAALTDNRCQQGGPTLTIAGLAGTIAQLREHFFNNVLWPDFTKIRMNGAPIVRFQVLKPEKAVTIAGMEVKAVEVDHTIDTAGFVVGKKGRSIAYSGDTGPTDRFWQVLNATQDLRAALVEVSFPDSALKLAKHSAHHTPATLAEDLAKLRGHGELPILVYHIKPVFQRETERELAKLKKRDLYVLKLGDHFRF